MSKNKTLILLISVLSAFLLTGYVQNISPTGNVVHWPDPNTVIDVYVNSQNTQGLDEATIQAQAVSSIAEWNGKSSITLRKNSSTAVDQDEMNEIYFSSDPNVFNGTGVVGITEVTYKNKTGEIIEADIKLNDSYSFSTNINDIEFIGNVITHELGHLLGLGHSQVNGASMFYALSRGQSKLNKDDSSGVYAIYPNGDATKAKFTGKIVGGAQLISVFGAHVEALSVKSGEVEGAVISDVDGTFSIDGLKKDEQYLFYVKPITNVGLPAKYNTARFNFCEANQRYRGSFFRSCGSSAEGFPQIVKLANTETNVGNITIRCNLDVPVDYFQGKGNSPATFDLLSYSSMGKGGVFTGFFTSQELLLGSVTDTFRLNLSNEDPANLSATGDLYVKLRVINQAFFSPFKANVVVKRNSATTTINPKYNQQSDGWLNIETDAYIPISRADLSDNDFEIRITPETMTSNSFPTGIPFAKDDYLPSYTEFEDSLNFYLVTATIVKSDGSGGYTQVSSKQDQFSDNSLCPDAVNTYSLTNYTVTGQSNASSAGGKKKKDGFLGCGSIDTNGSSGGGPTGFFIGLILSLLLCNLSSKIISKLRASSIVHLGRS